VLGKQVRLERIVARDSGRTVIIPMDHGTTVGPIAGLPAAFIAAARGTSVPGTQLGTELPA